MPNQNTLLTTVAKNPGEARLNTENDPVNPGSFLCNYSFEVALQANKTG
ncbi:MAG TPA: hypothetical protein VF610_07065 [Segetibacter sp.]|jgi:hypothetical protein